ncbi:hypothetical protein D3C78_488100 [compost metagenome]
MSDFVNHIYDRTIDYIENRANDNELRHEYAKHMSSQRWNNNSMNELVDVVATIADSELRTARSQREEEAMIRDIIVMTVDANVGAFGLSDRQFANSVPDDVYAELKRANAKWDEIMDRLTGRARGSRGNQSRGSFGGGGGRSVFDQEDRRFGGRQGGLWGGREEPREERASNSVFGGRGSSGGGRTERNSPVFSRDEERAAPAQRQSYGNGNRPAAPAREPEPEVRRQAEPVEEVSQDGPDLSLERPYDNFWVNGENWQIAHRSKFQWTWTPKQQTRRAYDPDNEVRFLVKGKDGSVREEFIAMTDDLVESAHEIREQQRPNRVRSTTERAESDSLFVGSDIDAVDLDALAVTIESARKEFLAEVDVTNPTMNTQGTSVASLEEAVIRVASEATKASTDVTSANTIKGIMLPACPVTMQALESISAIGTSDGDLLVLQKRLKSLRGTIAENVLTYLDKHFTNEVNAAVRDQFGLSKLSIDSFIDDFEDLLNCGVFKKHGTAYSSQFLSRTRVLLSSLHYMTDADQRTEFLECTDMLPLGADDPEAYIQFRNNVAVLFQPLAMVHVKINAEQLGFVDSEVRVPSRTGKGADAVLADALTALYAIGRKTSGAGRVYLVSADNLAFELVPISGARDIVGIRTA